MTILEFKSIIAVGDALWVPSRKANPTKVRVDKIDYVTRLITATGGDGVTKVYEHRQLVLGPDLADLRPKIDQAYVDRACGADTTSTKG